MHAPLPELAPLLAWQFLERNNRIYAQQLAQRTLRIEPTEPHTTPDEPGTTELDEASMLPRPTGAGRYVCAVITCAALDVPVHELFGLQREDVLVLRTPAGLIGPETAALLDRILVQHRLSLVLTLGHEHCDALEPSGNERPDALDRRLAALQRRAAHAGRPLLDTLLHRQRELLLTSSESLERARREDRLRVVPCRVDVNSRRVTWLHRRADALPMAPVK